MRLFILLTALTLALPARAALNILACEPEWAALAQELAGDSARISSATTARQDPHHIDARPSLIARTRNADLLVCTGAELESGWLPVLQRESGNPRIQTGAPGYLETASLVPLLDKPRSVDRSQGDIHAAGNPHLHLDPRNLLPIAEALAARMAKLDPEQAPLYAARLKDFQQRWRQALTRWEVRAAPLKGMSVAVHHKDWVYLAHWLGLKADLSLEPKPGVEPSVAHLGEVLERVKQQPIKAILLTNYQPPRASRWLAERTGAPVLDLPYTVGGSPRASNLFTWIDELVDRLAGVLK